MTKNQASISKRVSSLIAVGTMPAVVAGSVGDFFTPRGGWIVVGILGVLAVCICSYLLFTFPQEPSRSRPWWVRLFDQDEDLAWYWTGSNAFSVHGTQVVAVFGVACLGFAQISFAKASEGGILASAVPAISAAQEQLGVSRAMLAQQIRSNELLSNIAETAKKETSEDPRKELSNMGVAWSERGLEDAIRRGDARAIGLFVDGGMGLTSNGLMLAFIGISNEAKATLMRKPPPFDKSKCPALFLRLPNATVVSAGEDSGKLIGTFCQDKSIRDGVTESLKYAKEYYARQVAAYEEKIAARPSASECFRKELRNEGADLIADSYSYNFRINSLRNDLRGEVLAAHSRGSYDFKAMVRTFCEKQAEEDPIVVRDENGVKKWELLQKWLS